MRGGWPMRENNPMWNADGSLAESAKENVAAFRCCEAAELLGVSTRAIRYMATQGRIRFRIDGKKRLFSLSAIREVLRQREEREQGRRKHGVRPWLVDWAEGQLRRPTRHGKKPLQANECPPVPDPGSGYSPFPVSLSTWKSDGMPRSL